MASGKSLCTCAFLLLLILSYGIMHCEGRKMKAESVKISGDGGGGFVAESEESSAVGPGHSPGVGHSVGPKSTGPQV
ncbi:hypothetical protein Acr_00g0026900 [Actinidia rufa]|uniref:Uncharacterized protein n=1 Tax=Actinidia rufa TaxID=165716 RepID=A0A7J0DE27_9ERIC|nr:hypothetical protein Acr_00g0026900 [Actinidia rufa]